jgi:hypothetical protein
MNPSFGCAILRLDLNKINKINKIQNFTVIFKIYGWLYVPENGESLRHSDGQMMAQIKDDNCRRP